MRKRKTNLRSTTTTEAKMVGKSHDLRRDETLQKKNQRKSVIPDTIYPKEAIKNQSSV